MLRSKDKYPSPYVTARNIYLTILNDFCSVDTYKIHRLSKTRYNKV